MTTDPCQAAENYFHELARTFPVMCASDEFHFLPRAARAAEYYHRLDNLDQTAVLNLIDRLKQYRQSFLAAAHRARDLEQRIDWQLLGASAAGALIELEEKASWRHNPLLYLKIAFIGLDHALNKPALDSSEKRARTQARLEAIPTLLQQGIANLDNLPRGYHSGARAMVEDGRAYLKENAPRLKGAAMDAAVSRVRGALDRFKAFLLGKTPVPDAQAASSDLASTLRDHFLARHRLQEVFEMASDEWQQTLATLGQLQARLDPGKTWQELYHAFLPAELTRTDTLDLYRSEINALKTVFAKYGFSEEALSAPLEVAPTPTYLRTVRSSASFGAALRADADEISYFYITTVFPRENGRPETEGLRRRLHREYKFLTAHETIPGHHLLDSSRRRLDNPVRRQVESPLFYEGWATYVESLLIDQGHVSRPIELLVHNKRRLWRAARCMIDVGLHTGRLSKPAAVDLLVQSSFDRDEAQRQVERFGLNPGYQLCYSLGRWEFERLRKAFSRHMPAAEFHAQVLQSGELPFDLLEERLEAHVQTDSNP